LQEVLEEIDLYKEIENVNSYIEIEKARFGDKLEIIYDIPNNINCKLPPLILQPIVENAIKHGVLGKLEGGKVEIIASKEENSVKLIVKDDGVGISEEKLKTLLKKDSTKDSIGLINVNERLKNKYGNKYGLDIKSEVYKGTVITMIIPNA